MARANRMASMVASVPELVKRHCGNPNRAASGGVARILVLPPSVFALVVLVSVLSSIGSGDPPGGLLLELQQRSLAGQRVAVPQRAQERHRMLAVHEAQPVEPEGGVAGHRLHEADHRADVEVLGIAQALQTDSSYLGQVVDAQRIVDLPLNGRFFTRLALLTSGTLPTVPGARDEATGDSGHELVRVASAARMFTTVRRHSARVRRS